MFRIGNSLGKRRTRPSWTKPSRMARIVSVFHVIKRRSLMHTANEIATLREEAHEWKRMRAALRIASAEAGKTVFDKVPLSNQLLRTLLISRRRFEETQRNYSEWTTCGRIDNDLCPWTLIRLPPAHFLYEESNRVAMRLPLKPMDKALVPTCGINGPLLCPSRSSCLRRGREFSCMERSLR